MNRCFYLLASALFFFACSDDNGTNSSENAKTAEYQQVAIDKKNRRITVNQDAHTEEYCILQQGSFRHDPLHATYHNSVGPSTGGGLRSGQRNAVLGGGDYHPCHLSRRANYSGFFPCAAYRWKVDESSSGGNPPLAFNLGQTARILGTFGGDTFYMPLSCLCRKIENESGPVRRRIGQTGAQGLIYGL